MAIRKQFIVGLTIGVLGTIVSINIHSLFVCDSNTEKESTQAAKLPKEQEIVSFKDGCFLLYGGQYSFTAGEGDISNLENDIKFDDGKFNSASSLIPSGAVLVAIKEHYTIGYYEGKIKVSPYPEGMFYLEKVFFVIKNGIDGVRYYAPHKDPKYSMFLGDPLKGAVTFEQR